MGHIYQWMKQIASYLVLMTVAMQLVLGETYKKYIRFFVGLILILMIIEPIWNLFGMDMFQEQGLKSKLKEIEQNVLQWEEELEECNQNGNEDNGIVAK